MDMECEAAKVEKWKIKMSKEMSRIEEMERRLREKEEERRQLWEKEKERRQLCENEEERRQLCENEEERRQSWEKEQLWEKEEERRPLWEEKLRKEVSETQMRRLSKKEKEKEKERKLWELELMDRLSLMEVMEIEKKKEEEREIELDWEKEVETKTYPNLYGHYVCFERINFSSQAIINLHERLFGKGRAKEFFKKLVYLCVSFVDSSSNMSWLSLDADTFIPNSLVINDDSKEKGKEVLVDAAMKPESSFPPKLLPNVVYVLSNPELNHISTVSVSCVDESITTPVSGFPPDLRDLTCYGCTVWESTIIIAGGKCGEVPSDKVYFYNKDSKTWNSPKVMLLPRDAQPTVVAANSHLFVFGGFLDANTTSWAEEVLLNGCSDFEFLPRIPTAPEKINYKIISHAVYENQDQILLLIHPSEVLSFNFVKMEWGMSGSLETISKGLEWSDTVVVFEDFLIWHHYGTIYLHDLLNHVTVRGCTLPRTVFSSAMFNDKVSPPRFLVHTGQGKLCLFYQAGICIRYITFWVKISADFFGHELETPGIVIGHSGFLYTPPISDIHHALELPFK